MQIAQKEIRVAIWASLAAFGCYFSLYALRKPFAAASFEGVQLWGLDYKIVLIISQLAGYVLSKMLGIKFVSELNNTNRVTLLLGALGLAELALIGFGCVPAPYNLVFLFINGLPLGMVFGIVFSFIEGRRMTELMSLGLGVSIIFASGATKSVGKILLDTYQVSPWWMPALTGLIFVPLLSTSVWMLTRIPPPSHEDLTARQARIPMDSAARRQLFRRYAPGIVLLVLAYIMLTVVRDVRDNFAVEIWTALGVKNSAAYLAQSELWISLLILVAVGGLSYVRDNQRAFQITLYAIILGSTILGFSTWLYAHQMISPMMWIVGSGFGLFLGYTIYQGILFERMIATFRETANVGFLMYLADSFGYLGSATILVWRNIGAPNLDWLAFFRTLCYLAAVLVSSLTILAWMYFMQKQKNFKNSSS
jgi:Family of unknown function (DUF5690)